MVARLSDYLAGTGLVAVETLRSAIARQAVYGGALDTALLEIDAIDEGRLWQALGAATGLPLPAPDQYQTPIRCEIPAQGSILLDLGWSERWRAVPAGFVGEALAVLCGEPVANSELDAASAALAVPFSLFVAPEVRLAAVRQAVYGAPMPSRLVRLFARIAGAKPVRRWQATQARSAAQRTPVARDETFPDAGGPAASVAAPTAATDVGPAAAAPPAGQAAPPIDAVDKRETAALLRKLDGAGKEARSAHAALVRITKQDFGKKRRRWEAWWAKHQDDSRVEWLFEGLAHKEADIRASAEEELRALTGEYFGYHFDLPRPEREEARSRWQNWWYESGRARRR